jgi:hypothetical protein
LRRSDQRDRKQQRFHTSRPIIRISSRALL